MSDPYYMIDRFLRNNLGDEDYAEYSEAWDSIYLLPPQREPLTDDEIDALKGEIWGSSGIAPRSASAFARAVEAKLKEKNS